METVEKKYGLWTSIAMIVGVVIGSGIFYKADDVLVLTNGNLMVALLAWVIGATSMIFGSLVFAQFAQHIEKANGIVDYSEQAYGRCFGYLVGWFNGILYYSPLTAILSYISALYTLALFGVSETGIIWLFAWIYLSSLYLINYLSPKLSGRLQVSTTIIKLIPLLLVAVFGILIGLYKGDLIDNVNQSFTTIQASFQSFPSAVVSTAFAFEGWIVATTINNEIKDAKKNLPTALIVGALIIFLVYISYFLGIAGVIPTVEIISLGNQAVGLATTRLFGALASTILILFVVISCLGTLNGLIVACIRSPYSLAIRGLGPKPKLLSQINPKTKMPPYTTLFAYVLSNLYLFIWYGSLSGLFNRYIGLDEIPIVMIYGIYIFLYIFYMKAYKELNWFKRFFIPGLAILGSLVILYGGLTNPSIGLYLIISLVVLLSGLLFYKRT